MTIITISTFRKDMAKYIRLAKYQGKTIRVVDEKRGEVMGDFVPPHQKKMKKIHPSTQAFLDLAGIVKTAGKKENISGTIDKLLYGK